MRLWEAATALFDLCVKKGRGGTFYNLGQSPKRRSGNAILRLISNLQSQEPKNRCQSVLVIDSMKHKFEESRYMNPAGEIKS